MAPGRLGRGIVCTLEISCFSLSGPLRMRLDNIYLPMGAMFLARHVDVTVGIFDPPFRIKMKKAWAILVHRKRRLHVVAAAQTLFEKKRSTSAGIEFGGEFPLREILAIVRNYITIADGELQAKVRRADRSRYEEWGNNSLLTEEEFDSSTISLGSATSS